MRPGVRDHLALSILTLTLSAALFVACGGTSSPQQAADTTSRTTARSSEDLVMRAEDFQNIHRMTKVRGFFIDNRSGHLRETLAIARANRGGTYPVGTVIQLVPQEAMVKRRAGFSPETRDWEFFSLDVAATGTTIADRGGVQVVNHFNGGSCASCHVAAKAKFDFVCEKNHGCAPLGLSDTLIAGIQAGDPRPK